MHRIGKIRHIAELEDGISIWVVQTKVYSFLLAIGAAETEIDANSAVKAAEAQRPAILSRQRTAALHDCYIVFYTCPQTF